MSSPNEASDTASHENEVPDVTSEILQAFDQLKLDPHPPSRVRASKWSKRVGIGKNADDVQGIFEACLSAMNDGMKKSAERAELEIQGITDLLIDKGISKEYQLVTSFLINKALLEALDWLGMGIGIAVKWDAISIVLNQIKREIINLKDSVAELRQSSYKSAMKRFNDAIVYLKHDDHAGACRELEEVLRHAIEAFYLVERFEDQVQCKWLSCWSRVLRESYDEKNKKIMLYSQLPQNVKEKIGHLLFNDLKGLVETLDNANNSGTNLSSVTNVLKKSATAKEEERQDQMDRLLKIMLPMIWNHVEIFHLHDKQGDERKEEALRYIPEGKDDAANIHMDDPKLFVKVWKERKNKESGWQVVGEL